MMFLRLEIRSKTADVEKFQGGIRILQVDTVKVGILTGDWPQFVSCSIV